ncbi:LIC_10190 family membrane protein [Trichocoleus sp. FACHB-262]|uniref:LIC_10190 family membrane protein n=1 Tax=Trichocoleus sp. FACHB-262 TaxID=2692869 RepID=UPI0016842C18|nr:hypothetical protein [Trichocoleus sp. FACHB-262]MBD2122028.1 hypothetical protein [Trichocoleus sp. FACHB-262]
MLYFIAAWTLLSMACWPIGVALLNLLQADCFERSPHRPMAALWLGLIVLAVALLGTSLLLPLSPVVGGLVTVALVAASLLPRSARQEVVAWRVNLSPRLILGISILALAIAAITTRQVTWIDTGIYHYGSIRWLSEFGTVPGLALLKKQFGFASSWFALAAPLNPVGLGGRVSALPNGFAILLAVLHFWVSLTRSFTTQAKLSDWFATLFFGLVLPPLLFTHLLSVILVSPSPDIPVIFLTGVVAWSILVISEQRTDSVNAGPKSILEPELIPLILAAGAVTIKLTALPILLIASLFYLVAKRPSFKRLLMGGAVLGGLLLPMLLFSLVTSGCPLYPSTFLCLDLPWSQTVQEAKQLAEVTRGWGTWFGSAPTGVSATLWLFWQWFNAIGSSKLIVLLIGLSIVSMIYVFRTVISQQNQGQLWVLGLAVVGTSFMMLQSPLLRFGIGYVVLLPVLSVAILFHAKLQNRCIELNKRFTANPHRQKYRWQSWVLLCSGTLVLVALSQSPVRSRLVLPPALPKTKLTQQQVNNVVYFSPQNSKGACWAAEIPCSPQPAKNIWLRDPVRGLPAGFVRRPEVLPSSVNTAP